MARWETLSVCVLLGSVVAYNLDAEHPIVYEGPDSGEGRGYFGMSVSIRPGAASAGNEWTVQIGAPRGNAEGTSAREPGTAYRCPTFGPCSEFRVDAASGDSGGKGARAYREKKDGAWIGVSADLRAVGRQERSVICGHRWINQNLKNPENIDVTYLMTGVCYLQDLDGTSEAPVRKLLPLVDRDKIYTPYPYAVDLSTYHWGLGQAGLSVRVVAEPPVVVIGAPGVTHWIGSVVRYGPSSETLVGNFAGTDFARRSRYAYLGYAVTVGRFYGDGRLWLVAGAPRSSDYRGEALTFRFQGSAGGVHVRSNLVGSTFGEYFGSSLAAGDLNGDGIDDLVVGAPLYSERDPDEGRIYVYLGTRRGNFLSGPQVINGQAARGRFGTCAASAGDLDQDGRGDVAVGAPYEDDRRGAVYVFRGSSAGLEGKWSQRVSARDVYPGARGFGISISAPVDVDGNKYSDVAVGAYLSGHVVLLRSRPVVSLHPRIKTEDGSLIDRRHSYVNVTLCSRYSGPNTPDHLDVTREARVDPVHGRGSWDGGASSFRRTQIRVRSNEVACEVLPVKLDLSSRNYSPLRVVLKNQVAPCSTPGRHIVLIGSRRNASSDPRDDFHKWCPFGDEAEVRKEIPFAGVCGPDDVCRSDLKLSCVVPEFRSGFYVVGSSDQLVLSVEATNAGEPAFDATIKIWSNLKLREYDREYKAWKEPPGNSFWLLRDGTLTDAYRANFSFQIPPEALRGMKARPRFVLAAEVSTSSSEVDPADDACRFSVELLSESLVNFRSASSTTSLLFSEDVRGDRTVDVTHHYEVQRQGPTPPEAATLAVYVPVSRERDFLRFEVETSEGAYLAAQDEEPDFGNYSPLRSEAFREPGSREKRPPTDGTLFLNCSAPGTRCRVLRIFFADGIPGDSSSYVKILVALNVSAIASIRGEKDIVCVSTEGILRYREFFRAEAKELRRSASVGLYDEDAVSRLDARVVALSVLAGGVLLSLVVAALIKGNFFERIKKQELKALKVADASFVYFAAGSERPSPTTLDAE